VAISERSAGGLDMTLVRALERQLVELYAERDALRHQLERATAGQATTIHPLAGAPAAAADDRAVADASCLLDNLGEMLQAELASGEVNNPVKRLRDVASVVAVVSALLNPEPAQS
jgi:hypothetical protein